VKRIVHFQRILANLKSSFAKDNIGRVRRIFFYDNILSSIKTIVNQKIAIHVDDVAYLQQVIEHMLVVYKKLSSRGVPKEAVHIATLLQSIEQELRRLST